MRINIFIILILIGVTSISCNNSVNDVSEDKQSDLIEITKLQFESEKMEIGDTKRLPFRELVHFTGTISPSSKGLATISLPMSGIIQRIYCNPGESVMKGKILFEISGNELVDLQKNLAESSAILGQLKSEYERSKELFRENIGTQKELTLAESSYKSEVARYAALKIKLEQIGLDISKIESGNFYGSYSLKSPISGYISSINITTGQFVEPNVNLVEIINPTSFQVKMAVFEKDIYKLNIGQNVEFYGVGNRDASYNASLIYTGQTINPNSKAIECYANIENAESLKLVNNQFIEGDIVVGIDSVSSLPETAIIKSADNNYVLKLVNESDSSYFFQKVQIKTGEKNKGNVELIDVPTMKNILVNGLYNIVID